MSKRIVGIVLLLLGGLAMGWYSGRWAYTVFEKTVPAGAVTDLIRAGTRAAYTTGGLGFGVLVAAYAMLAVWISPLFRSSAKSTPPPGKM